MDRFGACHSQTVAHFSYAAQVQDHSESLFVGNFEGNDSTGTQVDFGMINRLMTGLLTNACKYFTENIFKS